MEKAKLLLLSCLLFIIQFDLIAQPFSLPIQHYYLQEINQQLDHQQKSNSHTAVKPFINGYQQIDSTLLYKYYRTEKNKDNSWLKRKLFDESLMVVDTGDFFIAIDPMFDFSLTRDFNDNSLRADTTNFINNTRGFFVRGSIGKNLSFSSSFYENQTFFPNYIDSIVRATEIVPGQGRVKPFKNVGYDYAFATGNIVYAPSENYFVEIANGKQFYGEGFRSVLLSDNAFNYPYLRLGGLFAKKRISYNLTFAAQQSMVRLPLINTPEAIFFRKNSVIHFLNFIVHPKIHIGLFEAGMWRTEDYNQLRPYTAAYYNPVMLASPLAFSNDSLNNFFHGLNLKLMPFNNLTIYSQLAISHSNSKFAYQVGLKYYDVLGIKNLYIQLESNRVEATYFDSQGANNNPNAFDFTHFNQSLAHPFVDGFQDFILNFNYSYKRFLLQSRIIYATFDERQTNTIVNFNGNSSIQESLLSVENSIGYVFNNKTNTQLLLAYHVRQQKNNNFTLDNNLFYLTLRSNLFNKFYN